MKKLFYLSIIFVIIFASCSNRNISDSTTQSNTITDSSTAVLSSELNSTDITNSNPLNPQLSTKTNESEFVAESKRTDIHREEQDLLQNSSPIIIYLTLKDLQEIKTAFDAMEPDNFMEYIKKEKTEQYMTGFEDYESSKNLLNEICMTTVPLLGGNPENFSEIAFFYEDSRISQPVEFDEEKRASVIIYTANSSVTSELTFDDNTVVIAEKTIVADDTNIKLYEVENNYYRFFADMISDNSYIVLRSIQIDSMEDFEDCIKRLEFVKIGDLLDNPGLTTDSAVTEA